MAIANLVGARVRDYAAILEQASSFNHALDLLMEVVQREGYTQVLYAYQPIPPRLPNGEWLPLKLNVRNFPRGWERGWERFMADDPYYHACFDGTLPFDWADVQNSERLSAVQRYAWKYLADLGLGRGMTIPVHLPFGRFAVISAIVDRSCANWMHIASNSRETMFHLTHVFHKTIHGKQFEDQVEVALPVRLSPREMECLYWAAGGKTSPEIAHIIERSVETVRLHIKNAIHKLNASNRAHAIAKATQMGLFQPSLEPERVLTN
jgi:LuxR family transcriptional regulator, quorum-sensing system regulator SdiA